MWIQKPNHNYSPDTQLTWVWPCGSVVHFNSHHSLYWNPYVRVCTPKNEAIQKYLIWFDCKFKSVDDILKCSHSNDSHCHPVVLSCGDFFHSVKPITSQHWGLNPCTEHKLLLEGHVNPASLPHTLFHFWRLSTLVRGFKMRTWHFSKRFNLN